MTSAVSICNQAIGWLGGSLITSLGDDTIEAKLCQANYDPLRDAVLTEGAWTFATKRFIPALSTESPEWGYTYAFTVPNDNLLVLDVRETDTSASGNDVFATNNNIFPNGGNTFDWRLEDRKIVCDAEVIYAKGIFQVVDPAKFSMLFVQALAARLAADLAIPLTDNRQLQSDMWGLYSSKIETALAIDGTQGRRDKMRQLAYIAAR